MTDAPTVTVREWTDLVRRARLGRTVKGAALVLASYADFATGTRVRPGLARFALEAELHYNTAKEILAKLQQIGLIELVRRGRGRGNADEYRLTIGAQVLDELTVLSPAELARLVEESRRSKRRTAAAAGRTGEGVQPAPPAVQDDVRPGGPAVPADVTDRCTAGADVVTGGCTAGRAGDVRPGAPAGISHRSTTTPTPHSELDLDGDHPGAAGPAAAENRDSRVVEQSDPGEVAAEPLPDRCDHGFRARLRPDGTSTCVLCRRGAPGLHIVTTTRSA